VYTLAKSAEKYFRDYVRGGGKDNRKKQVARMIEFLDWAESVDNVRALHGLGKNHVIGFWKSHRELSDATAYKYWLAISKLWEWLDKHEAPPKPFKADKRLLPKPEQNPAGNFFPNIGSAIKFTRESQSMSLLKLANLTGCDLMAIEEIEAGNLLNASTSDVQNLLGILGIQLFVPRNK
jgi:hypothetical protein